MINWDYRPSEVANLLNPAFCGIILRDFIRAYKEESGDGVPYELLFLLLPIVLHSNSRINLPNSVRTHMHVWLQNVPEVRIGFSKRVKELVPFTKESISFLLQKGYLEIDEDGKVLPKNKRYRISLSRMNRDTNSYIQDYKNKSELVGKWFARTGSSSTIYTMWGIRP
ncbi:hypothetical protein CN563_13160 [Bacillus sp. AFS026049]|nr:hypothetical protein CN563_13160 [Bacillus sp. AFS026049]